MPLPPLELELELELELLDAPLVMLPLVMGSAVGRSFFTGQLRSKRGLVLKLSVMANLTLLAGFASRRVYQKTFLLPKSEQPTSFQYVSASSTVDLAAPKLGPEYAQPVSVTHTSLPPDTPSTALMALLRSLPAFSILLSCSSS